MTRFVRFSIACAILLLSSWLVLPAASAAALVGASSKQQACTGINLDQNTDACAAGASGTGLTNLLSTAISILSIIIGVAAIIMIIIGGFKYITSQGESANTSSAKNTILYALVGLVIAVFAQVLVHFVLRKATIATGSIMLVFNMK